MMRIQKIKILLIEDDAEDADLLQEILSERNAYLFDIEWVKRLRIGIERLAQGDIDIVLLDLSLPDSQGIDTLKRIQAELPSVPIVVLSGLDDEAMAFTAVQLGAQDYLVKGEVDNRLLVRALRYAIERKQASESLRRREGILEAVSFAAERLLKTTNWQESLHSVLVHLGQATNASSVRIFKQEQNADNEILISCEYEWQAYNPTQPSDENSIWQQISLDAGGFGSWLTALSQGQIIHGHISDFPAKTQKVLLEQHIHSMVAVPIFVGEKWWGFINFNSCSKKQDWSDSELDAITAAVNTLGAAMQRQQVVNALQDSKANLERERALLAKRVEERTAKLSIANAQLARAARLKDEFLANMSHELRTPLNAVLGLCETLQEGTVGKINEEQNEYLQGITDSGRHLLSLINDILDIAKIEAGKVQLNLDTVIVEDVCRTSLGFIKQIATKKRLRITSYFDRTISTILADERRLKQILVNLLSNAVKFTPERGSIGLEVVKDDAEQVVMFTVWDTGVGIPEEELQAVFDPFVQVDSTLSRPQNGTGLGLALVRHLTEMHGGSVSVESKVNQGSRFTITLPIKTAEIPRFNQSNGFYTPPVNYLSSPPSNRASIKILLAEDNEANIFTISSYLRSKDIHVMVARNGEEALLQVKENKPDLILMDIQMPKMNGLDAIRRIRANENGAQIPIIALTAFAMPGDQERCLQAGANQYLSKPVRLKTLLHTIEQLTKHKPSSEEI